MKTSFKSEEERDCILYAFLTLVGRQLELPQWQLNVLEHA